MTTFFPAVHSNYSQDGIRSSPSLTLRRFRSLSSLPRPTLDQGDELVVRDDFDPPKARYSRPFSAHPVTAVNEVSPQLLVESELTAIHRMPDEMWLEVFEYLVLELDVLRTLGGTHSDDRPLMLKACRGLEQVNRQFRRAALSSFGFPHLSLGTPQQCRLWLERYDDCKPATLRVGRLDLCSCEEAMKVLQKMKNVVDLGIWDTDEDHQICGWRLVETAAEVFGKGLKRLELQSTGFSTSFPPFTHLTFPALCFIWIRFNEKSPRAPHPNHFWGSLLKMDSLRWHPVLVLHHTGNQKDYRTSILSPLGNFGDRLVEIRLLNISVLWESQDLHVFFSRLTGLQTLHFAEDENTNLPHLRPSQWRRVILPKWLEIISAIPIPLKHLRIDDETTVKPMWIAFIAGAIRDDPGSLRQLILLDMRHKATSWLRECPLGDELRSTFMEMKLGIRESKYDATLERWSDFVTWGRDE